MILFFFEQELKGRKGGLFVLGFFHLVRVCVPSCFSCVRLLWPLWTEALQAPLSMGFSRQEDWSGLPCPRPGDLSHPEMEPASLMPSAGRQVPYPAATNFIYWLMHCVEADMVGTWRLGPEGLCSSPAAALMTLDDLRRPWGKLLTSLQSVSLSVKSIE